MLIFSSVSLCFQSLHCFMYKADHEDSEDEYNAKQEQSELEKLFIDALLAENFPLDYADDETRPGRHLCSIPANQEAFKSADNALRALPTLVQAPVQFFLEALLPGKNLDFLFSQSP